MRNYFALGLIVIVGVLASITAYDQLHKISYLVVPVKAKPFLPDEMVIVTAHAYNGADSKLYLGHDLVSRGVQPLEIAIHNHTSQEYSLCTSSVDLPHVDPKDAAFQVTKSAIPRGIMYRVASLIFWPLAIPSSIDSFRTITHHRDLKTDYRMKAFRKHGEVILPYATYHRVLFVPKQEAQKSFQVTLINLETLEPKVYQVTAEGLES